MKSAVSNRPLSGIELKKIIQKDVDRVLEQDGMLANHIAFSRVAYTVQIKLHLDNPSYPEHVSTTTSRKAVVQELDKEPEREAVDNFPLPEPSAEVVKRGRERRRDINSPNRARIENGLPISVAVRQQDGTMENKDIVYDVSDYPDEVKEEILKADAPQDREVEG